MIFAFLEHHILDLYQIGELQLLAPKLHRAIDIAQTGYLDLLQDGWGKARAAGAVLVDEEGIVLFVIVQSSGEFRSMTSVEYA